jgi:cytochrome c peroxidase
MSRARIRSAVARIRESATFANLVTVAASAVTTRLALGAATRTAAPHPAAAAGPRGWTAEERATLRSLSLSGLGPLPADPSNRVADDPRAAALGEALFFDTRLSGNGKVSCGTCHVPAKDFQDGVALAEGVGTTARRTMPIAGTAHGARAAAHRFAVRVPAGGSSSTTGARGARGSSTAGRSPSSRWPPGRSSAGGS